MSGDPFENLAPRYRVMVKVAMLGLTAEQIDGVMKIYDDLEHGRKAKDRERSARWRKKQNRDPEPIVKDGKWNEGEWQRRRRVVFERDNYTCVYCGRDASDAPQCDHVHPVQHGGSSEIENLATACKQCNSSKAGKLLSEWERPEWE